MARNSQVRLGMRCAMKITIRSSTGSIQKTVLAIPSHPYSPNEPTFPVRAGPRGNSVLSERPRSAPHRSAASRPPACIHSRPGDARPCLPARRNLYRPCPEARRSPRRETPQEAGPRGAIRGSRGRRSRRRNSMPGPARIQASGARVHARSPQGQARHADRRCPPCDSRG